MKVISINNDNNLNFNGFVQMYNYNKNKHSCINTDAEQDKALSLLFSEYMKPDKLGVYTNVHEDFSSLSEMINYYNRPLSDNLRYFDYYLAKFSIEFEKILNGSITLPIKSKTTIYKSCCRCEHKEHLPESVNRIKIPDLFKLKHWWMP